MESRKFEDLLKELECIVEKLDNPAIPLNQGVVLFTRGIEVSKECLSVLNDNKGKISLLKQELEGLIKEPIEVE